jgi:hypothetical protein
MVSVQKYERELRSCIDSMVDEMNGIYGADLTESAKIDSKMGDIRLRDELIEQIRNVVRCKKISERMSAEQMRSITYRMEVRICGDGIDYEITRDAKDKLPSK